MTRAECPFCTPFEGAVFYRDSLVLGVWDLHPVSPRHALLVTVRHVEDWFKATPEEQLALMRAVDAAKLAIEATTKPDGYNIGINVGPAAGQTVFHLHVHLIPRYLGDVADPRGGVRHVLPQAANYLASAPGADGLGQVPHGRALVTGGEDDPLLAHLVGHLERATAVDIAVSFVLDSGVRLLEPHLQNVLDRGGRVRLLAGDYMGITDPDALLRLGDLEGNLVLRVFESAGTSFHTKAYIAYHGSDVGTAFVGSSNLSQTALREGVEWNYRVITSRDRAGFADVVAAFEALFQHSKVKTLSPEWIAEYRRRRRPVALPVEVVDLETPTAIPLPHAVQREALQALEQTRQAGGAAGLVVLATGLGKTWLSAFDSNRPEFKRILFVAHREEILGQAIRTFRAIRPSATLGRYDGVEKMMGADVLFASIQTLSRLEHLERFLPNEFDYIVVDEFHHASARTYRRLIEYFHPRFLLGLTATPERTDGGDLLALCGENLVYRCDMADGIRRGLLSPFDYYGVPDIVDYDNIPWRSNRFDEEELTKAVATQVRAQNAFEQYDERAGERTLGFCVSQRHADFMAEFFRGKGLRSVAVHAGPTSAPRAHALEQLNEGQLDILFAVDMFNEGVDLPRVDTVMMLRPTESAILWLQQFGRGLRWQEGKTLKVVDYIGNHRSFLIKPRTLLQLGQGDSEISYALEGIEAGTWDLPPGCSVTYDLEAKDILKALLRSSPPGERLRDYYREYRETHGDRPTAVEVFHDGLDPKSARPSHASWLSFVRMMGDLSEDQVVVHQQVGAFLDALETTQMTKSFKMVVLLGMLAEDALPGAISIERLEERVGELARRYALVRTEVGDALDQPGELRRLLENNPIKAWVEGKGTGDTAYFRYDGAQFATTFTLPVNLREPFQELVREIVEWRLAVYLRRVGMSTGADRIICRVARAGDRPILFLMTPRERMAGIPEGWVEVTADDKPYQAKFAKIAVNVLQERDGEVNRLPELLKQWFGEGAGLPGSDQAVVFVRQPDGYKLEPLRGEIAPGPRLWATYARNAVPPLFGFEFKGMESQSGVVERDKITLLFVTLEKKNQPATQRYEDEFLSPTEFKWQSQNRTSQESTSGQRLINHAKAGIGVHLFVRAAAKVRSKAQPFIYCGPLTFERWEGEKPITVWWKLGTAVPGELRGELRVGK